MKKRFFREIKIPEGVEVEIDENLFVVKGQKGENKREFNTEKLVFEKKDNNIVIGHDRATKKEKKMINTISAHIKNMINGVKEGFEYELKIVFNHFPITVDLKGNEALIKNFLGEKIPRKARIINGTEVRLDGNVIKVSSVDKELAGQTAANFETATKISMRDRRVFQDGIFIIKKAGREI